MSTVSVFWFRRDLRLSDNAGLFHALKSGDPVLCVFIFDRNILDKLPRADRRVAFIHQRLLSLQKQLRDNGSDLLVIYDTPSAAWDRILSKYHVKSVYCNHDYEPYARKRDAETGKFLLSKGVSFHTCKDQCIFEKDEVVKDDGKPYTVFTPYKNKYRAKLTPFYLNSYPTEKYFSHFMTWSGGTIPSLGEMGFTINDAVFPEPVLDTEILTKYSQQRDIPSIKGTSRLSMHLRFGTVSVRKLFRQADSVSESWTNELIWRDFYMQILWHFPHVVGRSFRPEYDHIEWRNDEKEFAAWCEGRTGYPLVDAGMRELNATGFMHNRVRMLVASFLVKHLLIDWRWGEAYFAEKLLDFDLSANNGGWQWAAGCGTDAAPYFRIFNPEEQLKKFDPEYRYVRKWVPEWGTSGYPKPIVDHKFARERCLTVFKTGLGRS